MPELPTMWKRHTHVMSRNVVHAHVTGNWHACVTFPRRKECSRLRAESLSSPNFSETLARRLSCEYRGRGKKDQSPIAQSILVQFNRYFA